MNIKKRVLAPLVVTLSSPTATLAHVAINRVSSPVRAKLAVLSRDEVEAELASIAHERAELEAYAAVLTSLLDSGMIANAPGDTAPKVVKKHPKTLREAILRVMGDFPEHDWRPASMLEELRDRGWAPNGPNARTQVNNRLSAMTDKGELYKEHGTYRLWSATQRSIQLEGLDQGHRLGDGKAV